MYRKKVLLCRLQAVNNSIVNYLEQKKYHLDVFNLNIRLYLFSPLFRIPFLEFPVASYLPVNVSVNIFVITFDGGCKTKGTKYFGLHILIQKGSELSEVRTTIFVVDMSALFTANVTIILR